MLAISIQNAGLVAEKPQKPQTDSGMTYRHQLYYCNKLQEGKSIHANIVKDGLENDEILASYIVQMYLKLDELPGAKQVFDKFSFQDIGLWTSMISAYARAGDSQQAILYFYLMQLSGVAPNRMGFITAVNICIALQNVREGRRIYEQAVLCGLSSNLVLGNSILNLYGICGSLDETKKMFERLETRDSISWTTLMKACNRQKQWKESLVFFYEMQLEGIQPDKTSLVVVLSACTEMLALLPGRKIHASFIGREEEQDVCVASTLVNFYNRCGDLREACKIFKQMPLKSLVSWNIMIAAYVHHGHPEKSLELLNLMQLEGIRPEKVTFVNSLTACSDSGQLRAGRMIHMCSFERGYGRDIVLATAVLNMYSKCRSVEDARRVFGEMEEKTAVSWNAMISAYAQNSRGREAIQLYHFMNQEGVFPTKVTFATLLDACGEVEALRIGEAVHERIDGMGIHLNLVLGTSLIRMYGKCSCLATAQGVFDRMQEEDVVLWTTMLGAYLEHGHHEQALALFQRMRIKPDNITFVCAIDACANAGDLNQGEAIHERIRHCGYETDILVGTALCYMYIQFGCLERALKIFNKLEGRTVVSWNAMVSGFVQRRLVSEALECFRKMLADGTRPDDITFAAILDSFVSQNYLGEGRFVHRLIVESGYESGVFIGTALLNMYGKCGSLVEAENIFFNLPSRTTVPWNALIVAYSQNGLFLESLRLFDELQLEGFFADTITFQCIISACSHAGLVEKGCEYMMLMIEDHGIVPFPEHYSCMVDLLGRAGWLKEAEDVVLKMPRESQAFNAMSLLSSCRTHGDGERGKRLAKLLMKLAPARTGAYSLLSNIFAEAEDHQQEEHSRNELHV